MKELGTQCAYCGQPPTKTEHVIASNMLAPGDHALTVPACAECNFKKNESDIYLRDTLALQVDTKQFPHLQWLADRAVSSAQMDRDRPAKGILKTYCPVIGVSPTGELGVVGLEVTVEGDRIKQAFNWIVRGLWFKHFNSVLSIDTLDVNGFNGVDNQHELQRLWPDFDPQRALAVGTSVRYRITASDTVQKCGVALVYFYDLFLFTIVFNEPMDP